MLSRCTFLPSRYAFRASAPPSWLILTLRRASRIPRRRFTPEQAQEKYEMRIEVLKTQREKARIQAQKDGDLAAQARVYGDFATAQKEAQRALAEDLREAHGVNEPAQKPKAGADGQPEARVRSRYSYKVMVQALTALIIMQVGIELLLPEKYKPRNWYKTWTTHDVDAFQTFQIVNREAVSSTASLFTLKPIKSTRFWNACKEAQQKGVWNVQFKQPQIQVVRAYTPLPSLNPEDKDLTFLIRHETGGEVSNWLRRLPIGSEIDLRGPFMEFEIPKETGRVIFLAGGTGIAPALQAAESLLNQQPSANKDADRLGNGKKIDILWACRRREDCTGGISDTVLGGSETSVGEPATSHNPGFWFDLSSLWKSKEASPSSTQPSAGRQQQPAAPPNQVISRLTALKARFPNQVSITYFVDEESAFITAGALRPLLSDNSAASTSTSASTAALNASRQPSTPPSSSTPPPSKPSVSQTPTPSPQTTPSQTPPPPPTSQNPPKKPHTQILISGPDGFIAALAGAKVWTQAGEEQGPLGGMLSTVLAERQQQGQQRSDVSVYKI